MLDELPGSHAPNVHVGESDKLRERAHNGASVLGYDDIVAILGQLDCVEMDVERAEPFVGFGDARLPFQDKALRGVLWKDVGAYEPQLTCAAIRVENVEDLVEILGRAVFGG